MHKKSLSGLLTLILGLLLLTFFAFTHIVGASVVIPGADPGFPGLIQAFGNALQTLFTPDFSGGNQIIGFVAAALVLIVAVVFAIVWVIRLLVFRRHKANLLSPLFFFVAILIGVVLVSSHAVVELAFSQPAVMVATAYWFITGVVIVALGLHLLVVGLKNSGAFKKESIIPEDIDFDVYEEIDEQALKPEQEPVETKVNEPEKVVVQSEVQPQPVEPKPVVTEEKAAAIDPKDPDLDMLIRRIANEEIDKRPISEKVIVREIEKVVVQEPKKEVSREPKVEPKPEPKPEAKAEVKPEIKVEPIVKKINVPPPPKEKEAETVERLSFPERMQVVEKEVKADYNLLKNYLLSFGLNSRISNVADSFRLGRVLYAKLTNSGNTGLKLYLPIKIDDYKDSKIPLKSAEGIKQYEEVPTFIYVRSDLSMKRAKQLVDDVMLKNGITRKYDAQDVDHIPDLLK